MHHQQQKLSKLFASGGVMMVPRKTAVFVAGFWYVQTPSPTQTKPQSGDFSSTSDAKLTGLQNPTS